MSDLFHEALPDEAIDRIFAVMALWSAAHIPGANEEARADAEMVRVSGMGSGCR